MTDREAWIASIIDDPKNDLRRLVFADWLDEHDEPERAEFIRVQIQIAQTPLKITAGNRCLKCDRPGHWRRGVGFEHEKRCGHCTLVWEPGEQINNPNREALQSREQELWAETMPHGSRKV